MKIALVMPFLVLVLAGSAGAQAVHVVDASGGPGTEFTDLQDAVSAAQDGDVLLVRAGQYFATTIVAKSLVIQADTGASVVVDEVTVRDLPAGGAVAVRGVTVDGGGTQPPSVEVRDCLGSVWLEDCTITGVFQAFFAGGVLVEDSASVVLDDCRLDPPATVNPDILEPTLTLVRSTVHLFDCDARGRPGSDQFFFGTNGPGSVAIEQEEGELWIQGSLVHGGRGGNGTLNCTAGEDGASALVLSGASPAVFVQDSEVLGGVGGTGSGGCPNGTDALAVDGPPGSVTALPGSARRLQSPSPVRDDEVTTLSASGVPGDRVYFLYSLAPRPRITRASFTGPLLLRAPIASIFAGTIGPGGTLVMNVQVGDLGPLAEGIELYLQALLWNPALGERVVSTPSVVVLLDASL